MKNWESVKLGDLYEVLTDCQKAVSFLAADIHFLRFQLCSITIFCRKN